MEQPQYQYKILEAASDYKETKIEKSGITATFTLNQVETNQSQLAKMKRELEGQIKVDDATMQNVAHFHPEVLDVTDESLKALELYSDAKTRKGACERKLKEVDDTIAELEAETHTIMDTLGFKPAEMLSDITSDNTQSDGTQTDGTAQS